MRIFKGIRKTNFFKLLINNNTNVSSVNFFVVATTLVGLMLLIIAGLSMVVDLLYNHTLTLDIKGLGDYILSVTGIFVSGGIVSAWTEASYAKHSDNYARKRRPEQ